MLTHVAEITMSLLLQAYSYSYITPIYLHWIFPIFQFVILSSLMNWIFFPIYKSISLNQSTYVVKFELEKISSWFQTGELENYNANR